MRRLAQFTAVLIASIALIRVSSAADDDRRQGVKQELEAARETLKEITTPKDKELWERKVAILEEELKNIDRLTALERRERQHARTEAKSDHQILVEALSAINTDTAELDSQRQVVVREIQRLAANRQRLEEQLSEKPPETESDYDRFADLEQQRKNLDCEALAQTFRLGALDLAIRLRADAELLRKEIPTAPTRQRTPTLRMLAGKLREVRDTTASRDFYAERVAYLEGQKEQAGVRLELAKERSTQTTAEYELLRDRLATERRTAVANTNATDRLERQRRLARLMSTARSESRMLQPRINSLQDQVRYLDETLAPATAGRDLFEKTIAFLESNYESLRRQAIARATLLLSIIAIIVLLQLVIEHVVLRYTVRREHLFITRRLSRYITVLVVLVVMTFFFFEDIRSIATILGLATAAVVIALQDLCSSFVGWFLIALSKKVKVGDRIEVNGIVGDILDIQLLRTTLQECRNWLGCDDHTGRIVVIPNHFILKAHLFNYNFMHPMIWRQLDVLVTYETPPQEAYDLLKRILEEEARENVEEFRKDERRMQAEFDLTEPPQELKIHTTIADSGVHFALLYPVHYRKSASFRSRLSKRIVDEFAKRPELQFAYPTQRHIPTPEAGGLKVQVTQR